MSKDTKAEKVEKTETAVVVKDTTAVATTDAYAKLVNDIIVLTDKFNKHALEFYYSLGEQAHELTEKPDSYGNASLNKLADDLAKHGTALKASSLYKAQSLFVYLSVKQIAIAKNSGMALRKVLALCNKKLTPEVRQAVLEDAAAHKDSIRTYDVVKAIADKMGESAPATKPKSEDSDTTSLVRAVKVVKGAARLVEVIEQKLKDVGACVRSICDGDDEDRMRSAYEQFGEAISAMESLTEVWRIQQEKAKKAFDKVNEVIRKKK